MGSILIVIGLLIFFNQLTLLINIPFIGTIDWQLMKEIDDKLMNKDNISAIITAVAVISLITGFGIYFNFYSKYLISYVAQKQLENTVDKSLIKNGDIINIKLNKTAFLQA